MRPPRQGSAVTFGAQYVISGLCKTEMFASLLSIRLSVGRATLVGFNYRRTTNIVKITNHKPANI